MARLWRKQLLTVKSESSYGVDAVPTAADDAVKAACAAPTSPDIAQIQTRDCRTTFSPRAIRVGRILNAGDFEKDMTTNGRTGVGDSLDPQRYDAILKSCGLIPTYTPETGGGAGDGDTTYNFSTSSPVSMTQYAYLDGVLHKYTGAYSSVSWTFEAGQPAGFSWSPKGIYTTPTDVVLPSATYDEIDPVPICASMALTIGAFTPVVRSATLNLNVDIPERADLNSALGLKGLIISGRQPELEIVIESVLESELDVWAQLEAGTVSNINFELANAAAGKVLYTAPTAQITNIAYSDQDGIALYTLSTVLTGTDAGDDELSIKLYE